MKYLLLIAAITLCGCVRKDADSYGPPMLEDVEPESTSDSNVRVILLKDGTRCAVYSGYKAGGISCNWKIAP